ncbi:MAG: NHL repeat-containing protein [Lysobacterales bacterium]|jgi:hypothetical protein
MRIALILLCLLLPATELAAQQTEIYVSDAGNFDQPPWQILKFDANGENPEVFIDQNLAWPQDIVFLEQEGTVLISNFSNGHIDRYDAATGDYIDAFAVGISSPTRMKIGADNLLYVLQWNGNSRVRRYQLDGTFVDLFTEVSVPRSIGLDWDSDGNLYVSSYTDDNVRKFGPDGSDLGLFIDSNLAGPTNIWFDESGDLLVADYDGGAVKRFGPDGSYKGVFISGLSQSEGVGHLPNGNLLIGNGGTHAVKMYTPDGAYVKDLVPSGSGNLLTPNAVVVRQPNANTFQINAGIADAWYNPATSGQGFLVTVFPVVKQVFLAWFTYDTERPPEDATALLGEPGHRWLTAQGPYDGDTAELTVSLTSGGVFDAAEPAATTDPEPYGAITLEFADCSNGMATYDIPSLNLSGEIPLQRIAEDGVALCEELAAP